ncbi:Hypothetical predicted protein [Olea europaea subsp. europaea]|uniref:Uncharacterized protein n=1 Tax=Olea europaea subsp. europaea TaxID=158383 RepID=A0A8S0RAR6_OLEEU|nr:Hypothetical predicted protein [Olea europaea subsp. europaea]
MTYLVLRLEGREIRRIPLKKESMAGSCSKENAVVSFSDADCSFSGPSKTFSPERIVQKRKPWLNYELIEKEVPKLKQKKSLEQKRQSNKAKMTIDKEKVEWLKSSRDYSFLSADDDMFHGSGIKPNPWMVKNVSKSCDSMPKKKYEVSRSGTAIPKPQVLSSKPLSKESKFKNSGRSILEGHVRKRRQVIYEDEDDDDDQAIDIIRTVRYDPKKFTDNAGGINVEATSSDTRKEETQSASRLQRKKIVEQEERETKKRKMY